MLSQKNKDLILSVLDGKEENVSLECAIPMDIEDFLKEEAFPDGWNEIDSNGWQYDFWIDYKRVSDKKEFMWSGGWYDGKNNFGIKEE